MIDSPRPDLLAACWTSAGDVMPARGSDLSPVPIRERIEAVARTGYTGFGLTHPDLVAAREAVGLGEVATCSPTTASPTCSSSGSPTGGPPAAPAQPPSSSSRTSTTPTADSSSTSGTPSAAAPTTTLCRSSFHRGSFGVELDDSWSTVRGTDLEDTFDNRVPCGEGEFDVPKFIHAVRRIGFDGPWGVEHMSQEFRQLPVVDALPRARDGVLQCFARADGVAANRDNT